MPVQTFSRCAVAVAVSLAVSGCSSLGGLLALPGAQPHLAVAAVDSDAERHYAVAKYWLKQNQREEALASLDRVLAIDPRHVEALNARASIRADQGALELARIDLDQALALAPDRQHLRDNRKLLSQLIEAQPKVLARTPTARAVVPAAQVSRPTAQEPAPTPQSPSPVAQAFSAAVQVQETTAQIQVSNEQVQVQGAPAVATLEPAPVMVVTPSVPTSQASAITASGLTVIRVPAEGSESARSENPVVTIAPPAPAPVLQISSGGHESLVRIPSFEALPMAALEPRPIQDLRIVGATLDASVVASAAPAIIAIAPQPAEAARIDVANGNGINGMARALRGQLRSVGVQVATISNWSNFNQPITRVLYRQGYEQAARELAQHLPVQVELVATDRLPRAGRDVMVVLGRDMRGYRATAFGWESLARRADIPAA
jgi:tetratricopeptide (TPR) repeat protein